MTDNPFTQQGQQPTQTFSAPTQYNATFAQNQQVSDQRIADVTFDDDIKINHLESLDVSQGETVRVAFVVFDVTSGTPRPAIKQSEIFYDDMTKKMFLAPKTPSVLKQVVGKLGRQPQMKFATVILKYDTDKFGNFLTVAGSPGYQLMAWTFSTDKFQKIRQYHKEWGLANVDFTITCTDNSQYKKWDISPCRDKWINSDPSKLAVAQDEARMLYDTFLPSKMGSIIDDIALLALLGIGVPQHTSPQAMPPGFNPFGNQVGGVGQVKQEDFSHLVQPVMQQPIQQPVQAPMQQNVQAPMQQPVQQPIQQPMQQTIDVVATEVQQPIQQPVQAPMQESPNPFLK